jgi:Tfp pilus assembly protein PilO
VASWRGRFVVAVGIVAVIGLLLLFLVFPKLHQVSDARKELETAQSQQTVLEAQKAALEVAKSQAPQARRTIASVNNQIPETADEPGIINLLNNAAISAGIDIVSLSPGTPTFDPTKNLSTIPVAVSVTGTYFEIAQYLYDIETLPRAAVTTTMSLSPNGTSSTGSPLLTATLTVNLFTSDTSAGPLSAPGPTTGATGTTSTTTTTTTTTPTGG